MPRALNLLRASPHYRRDAFDRGLSACGYVVVASLPDPKPDDVLLIWNRYGRGHAEALRFEAAGATVLVAENGYLGVDWLGDRWYCMARSHHLGAGHWTNYGPGRWDALGVELAPWRPDGAEVVVLPQRGIGEPGIAQPRTWAWRHCGRVRPHPGTRACTPLQDDLANAKYVVTWASGAALKALLWGIPVYHEFQRWIGAQAARPTSEIGREPKRCDEDRLAMFRRLAWCNWRLSEIASGEAFRRLLEIR